MKNSSLTLSMKKDEILVLETSDGPVYITLLNGSVKVRVNAPRAIGVGRLSEIPEASE